MITLTIVQFIIILLVAVFIATLAGATVGGSLLMYYYKYKKGMYLINQMINMENISDSLEDDEGDITVNE
jgi:4-hydroxybenzoate polyprenyltransferase